METNSNWTHNTQNTINKVHQWKPNLTKEQSTIIKMQTEKWKWYLQNNSYIIMEMVKSFSTILYTLDNQIKLKLMQAKKVASKTYEVVNTYKNKDQKHEYWNYLHKGQPRTIE